MGFLQGISVLWKSKVFGCVFGSLVASSFSGSVYILLELFCFSESVFLFPGTVFVFYKWVGVSGSALGFVEVFRVFWKCLLVFLKCFQFSACFLSPGTALRFLEVLLCFVKAYWFSRNVLGFLEVFSIFLNGFGFLQVGRVFLEVALLFWMCFGFSESSFGFVEIVLRFLDVLSFLDVFSLFMKCFDFLELISVLWKSFGFLEVVLVF